MKYTIKFNMKTISLNYVMYLKCYCKKKKMLIGVKNQKNNQMTSVARYSIFSTSKYMYESQIRINK